MKKRDILIGLGTMAIMGISACGPKELTLVSDQVEVELGDAIDATVTNYVADEKMAADAAVDLSAVDTSKTGTYTATVTYKDQTASFEVIVVDTTAPKVTVTDQVVVAAGEPLYAADVITEVTELSGAVSILFAEPELTEEATEAVETAEESTEALEAVETERMETTEVSAETALEPFMLNEVLCGDACVILSETGEYDVTMTVADASGNSTAVLLHVVVGDAPKISGISDLTVTLGTDAEEIDYLDGVTATDSKGNDLTADITCDTSLVDLANAGVYEISYTVTDADGFTATERAMVEVVEKGGKKSTTAKNETSGKTTSKTDSKNTSGNKNSNNNASAGSASASDSNTNTSGGNSDNGGSQQTSNSGTGGSSSNNGSQQTPAPSNPDPAPTPQPDPTPAPIPTPDPAPSPAPSEPEMSEPDNLIEGDPGLLDNTGTGGTGGGGGVTSGGW